MDIVYQIFVDRFAIGSAESSASKLSQRIYHEPEYTRCAWDEPIPDSQQHPLNDGKVFYGGDLDGIIDHLNHIRALGATLVYLTPIFRSPTNHKYNTTDYFAVDAMFGGDAALQRLIDAAEAHGLGIMLDAVLNHVADTHPWFAKAQAGELPYADWFAKVETGGYSFWSDVHDMPELNLSAPSLRARLYQDADSAVQKYLAMGIKGWRFDVAQDLGLAIARDIRQSVHSHYPNAPLIGELMGFCGDWLKAQDGFTGMMNYWHREAVLGWLLGNMSARQASVGLAQFYDICGHTGTCQSWNMLSSHDKPRLATAIESPQLRKLARLAQFTLPGIPFIYYGEEIGLTGGEDPFCRTPMRWDENTWDHDCLQHYQQLIALRRTLPELVHGQFEMLSDKLDDNVLIFMRTLDHPIDSALVILNAADTPFKRTLMIPHSHWYSGMALLDALGSITSRISSGTVSVEIPAQSGVVLKPVENYRHYQHFKARNF